jgi:hypothetical protein
VRFALRALASAGAQPEFPSITNTTRALLYATLFTWVVAGVLVVARLVRRREDLPAFAPAFLLCWLVVPVGVDWVVSVSVQPVFITRYLLYSLPAGSILTAAVVTRLRPVVLGAAVTVAFLVLRFLQIPEAYGRPFENWQAPTAYVLAHDRPGDCIAFYVDDGRMPFEYYLRRTPGHVTPPRPVLPAVPWSGNPVEVEVNTPIPSAAMPGVIGGCPRLFLVASHDGSPLGSPHQRAAYGDYHRMLDQLDAGYPTVGSRRFGSVTIWLFSR